MSQLKSVSKLRVLLRALVLLVACFFSLTAMSDEGDSLLVRDSYEFYGLAVYLNNVKAYSIDVEGALEPTSDLNIAPAHKWHAWVGRFNVLVSEIDANDASKYSDKQLLTKDDLGSISSSLESLRYAHLWYPLALLTRFVEWVLSFIFSIFSSWGWTIIIYAVLVKILLFPVAKITARLQKEVGLINQKLAPTLALIKSSYDGEEAHNKIMEAHKQLGVGPFYSLKPLFATLIQLPLLIATFNALAEMPQIDGSSFLWIANLAYPDTLFHLPLAVPLMGDGINLLPLLMTLVSILAAYSYSNDYDPESRIKKQRRNLYLMALCFLILFYPFPAAMVLYWMSSNLLHLIQQKVSA